MSRYFLLMCVIFALDEYSFTSNATDTGNCPAHKERGISLDDTVREASPPTTSDLSRHEVDLGLSCEKSGDSENAMLWYLKAANHGDPVGQYNVGRICEQGREGRYQPDYTCAVKWLSLSATQGNPRAQYRLGMLYFGGVGVPKNYGFVKKWIEKSALSGFAPAQVMLGNLYEEGIGVDRDYKAANSWYRKAADQNFSGGQLSLGLQYLFGRGVDHNELTALMWFLIAKDGGASVGERTLVDIKHHLGSTQVTRAQDMAREWRCSHNKSTEDKKADKN